MQNIKSETIYFLLSLTARGGFHARFWRRIQPEKVEIVLQTRHDLATYPAIAVTLQEMNVEQWNIADGNYVRVGMI